MSRVPRSFAMLLAVLAISAAACGGGEGPSLSGPKTASSGTTLPGTGQPDPVPPPTFAPGTSFTAEATVPVVKVYDSPSSPTSSREFTNPWFVNEDTRYPVKTVFLVEEERGDWVKVLLPVRPNGSTGWIRTSDVRLVQNRFHIVVDLSDHGLTVFENDKVFLEDTVAVGARDTPTPVGQFYIRVLLQAPDPTTVYGPYAYGLSSHSEALDTFDGGDAEVGIHGNNDASVLGKDVSHGCIRMDNDKITRLSTILPLGTPVEIQA